MLLNYVTQSQKLLELRKVKEFETTAKVSHIGILRSFFTIENYIPDFLKFVIDQFYRIKNLY
jgi:hypothetical protein